jgi:hypothetical protein
MMMVMMMRRHFDFCDPNQNHHRIVVRLSPARMITAHTQHQHPVVVMTDR